MKKQLRKIVMGLFLAGFVLSVVYHLNYREREDDNKNYVSERKMNSIRKYIRAKLNARDEKRSAYTDLSRRRKAPKENGVFKIKENDKTSMGNYLKETPSPSSSRNSHLSDLYVDSVIETGFESTGNSPNVGNITKGIDSARTHQSNSSWKREIQIDNNPFLMKNIPDKEKFMKEFKRRQQVIEQVCEKFNVQKDVNHIKFINIIPSEKQHDFMGEESYVEHVSPSSFQLVRSASSMTCLINKAGSTSLAVTLLKADRRPIPEWNQNLSPHNVAAVLRPQNEAEFNFARKHFFKFLLVRNPFERLLSAYRDKIEKADHWSLRKFRRHIINTLRKARHLTLTKAGHPILNDIDNFHRSPADETDSIQDTLKEALVNITQSALYDIPQNYNHLETEEVNRISKRKENQELDKRKHYDINDTEQLLLSVKATVEEDLYGNKGIEENEIEENGIEENRITDIWTTDVPTFSDFLEYILTTNLTDKDFSNHWIPYWERCSPCSLSYDVTAKLESADIDLTVVYDRLGIHDAQLWYNRGEPIAANASKQDMLAGYYSQLDPHLIGRVYRRYTLDFHLFEYDIMDVFRLAGQCVTSSCEEMIEYL